MKYAGFISRFFSEAGGEAVISAFTSGARFAALVAMTFTLLAIGWTALQLPRVLDARATADEAIKREGAALRKLAADELAQTRKELRAESLEYRRLLALELDKTRTAAKNESSAWRNVTSQEIATTRKMLVDEIHGAVNMADARLGAVAGATERTLDAYRVIPAVVGARLDPWTDCRGNGACWQAQSTAFLGAARVTAGRVSVAAKAWEDVMPSLSRSADRTAVNIERWTRPAPLLERVLRLGAPFAGGAVMTWYNELKNGGRK